MLTKIYKFYKNNCAPCYALSKMLLSLELPEHIEIIEKNVGNEENKLLAKTFEIDKVPALVFPDTGNKLVGQHTRSEIEYFLNNNGKTSYVSD